MPQFDHAVLVGAELIAPMDQRHAPGVILQIERPIHRAVAAADNEQVLTAEGDLLLDEVVDTIALEFGHARRGEFVRRESAYAGGDQH